jgi:hypothetical protein
VEIKGGTMEVKKLTEVKELDDLIPLITNFYNELGTSDYFSLAGYISWIVFNFPSLNFQVWKYEKEGKVEGFLIAQITNRHFVMECSISEAFINFNNEEVTSFVYDHIKEWAKENGCKQIAIKTTREKAFGKKYGFEYFGTMMIQKL